MGLGPQWTRRPAEPYGDVPEMHEDPRRLSSGSSDRPGRPGKLTYRPAGIRHLIPAETNHLTLAEAHRAPNRANLPRKCGKEAAAIKRRWYNIL
jgi:hypothetical protein